MKNLEEKKKKLEKKEIKTKDMIKKEKSDRKNTIKNYSKIHIDKKEQYRRENVKSKMCNKY